MNNKYNYNCTTCGGNKKYNRKCNRHRNGTALFQVLSLTVIFLLFIVQSIFAWWTESIDVQVVDRFGRGIEGADVSIVYQSSACSKHDVISKKTNITGMAHFEFMNTVLEEGTVGGGCVERFYTITGNYAGLSNSTIGTVGSRSKYTVILQAVKYSVRVVDADNASLLHAFAIIGGNKYFSDSAGVINLYLPIGRSTNVEIGFGNISKVQKVTIGSDTYETIQLPVYDLSLRLFDESGKRINGTVKIGDLVATVTQSEAATFENFPYSSATLVVAVDGKERNISINISSGTLDLYIDLSPPIIRDITATSIAKGNVKITATIADEGGHASGLIGNPVLKYMFENGTLWNEVKMYPTSPTSFEGTIPAMEKSFSYMIIAEDKYGNENIYLANFTFGKKEEGPTGGEIKIEAPSIEITHIIAIVIFVFVVFLIYSKIKESI